MNTETQLRHELHAALDQPAPSVALEPSRLIAEGSHIVRRRRLATAALGITAVAAIGFGAAQGLAGRDRSAPLPAGDGTSATAPVADASATISLPRLVPGDPHGNPAQEFVIKVGPSALGPTSLSPNGDVGFYAKSGGRLTLLAGSAVNTPASKSTVGSKGDDVVLALVPKEAVTVNALGFDGAVEGSGVVPIPGTVFSAVGFRLDRIANAGDLFLMWLRADGTPVTNDEIGIHTTATENGTSLRLWLLPKAGVFGVEAGANAASAPVTDGLGTIAFSDVSGGPATVATVIEGPARNARALIDGVQSATPPTVSVVAGYSFLTIDHATSVQSVTFQWTGPDGRTQTTQTTGQPR